MNPMRWSRVMSVNERARALLPLGLVVLGLTCQSLACQSGPAANGSVPAQEPAAAPPPAAAQPAQNQSPKPGEGAVGRYGAVIEPGPSVPLASLLSDPKAYANQTVTTEGKVQRACSRKGCWMEIGAGDDACRVTFKDYAFFVPTDSAGAFAKIQGRLDTREVEAAAVSHLESEGARFRNKQPDGSATEVRLLASAVELRR
jgi:hypothetical protein